MAEEMAEEKAVEVEVVGDPTQEERNMGMFCHLLGLAGGTGIPAGNVVGPLILWLIKKDSSEFIDACGKEAVNFQISMTIYSFVSLALCFVLIGAPLLVILLVVWLVCLIKAAMAANKGEIYKYPFSIHFFS